MKSMKCYLFVWLLLAGAGAPDVVAQSKTGMIQEDGVWKKPTPAMVLNAFQETEDPDIDKEITRSIQMKDAAVAVLRQQFDNRSDAELDAFAAELGRIVREGAKRQADKAAMALSFAAVNFGEGTPYTRALDVFIRVYETFEDRKQDRASRVLWEIARTGGVDYVRDLFEASEQPAKPCFQPHAFPQPEEIPPEEEWCPNESMWCQAGDVLQSEGDPAAPDSELHRVLCVRMR